MSILLEEEVDNLITPVRSLDRVGHPVIGYVVKGRKGFYALPNGSTEPADRRETFDGAIDYLKRIHA